MLDSEFLYSIYEKYKYAIGPDREHFEREVLESPEKALVRAYLWPRQNYLDGDLQRELEIARDASGIIGIQTEPEIKELCVFLEALRSQQYGVYLRRMIQKFTSSGGDVFPATSITGRDTTCEVCGKQILYWPEWEQTKSSLESIGVDPRSVLAYGHSGYPRCLCMNCIIQLNYLADILGTWKILK
jgi:hypothetical protein